MDLAEASEVEIDALALGDLHKHKRAYTGDVYKDTGGAVSRVLRWRDHGHRAEIRRVRTCRVATTDNRQYAGAVSTTPSTSIMVSPHGDTNYSCSQRLDVSA